MVGAILYLRLSSLRNRMVASVKRLRQPKYLASVLFGAGYLYLVFFRRMRFLVSGTTPRGTGASARFFAPVLAPEAVLVLAAVILFLVILVQFSFAWISPAANPRLKFTESEIAFLFPAPISRSRLIHFNLLSTQFNILLSSVILTVLFNRWSFLGGHALARAVGWWLILSTVSLQNVYTQLTVSSRIQRGGGGVRLRALAAIAIAVGALVYSAWQRARPPMGDELKSMPDMANYVTGWLDSGSGRPLLIPFKWVAGPFAAASLRSFALALGPALAIPGLLYFAIVRSEISFAEGSIAQAEHRAQVRTAARAGNYGKYPGASFKLKAVRAPFRLREHGRPEMAFFWKNLIAIQSWFNLRILIVILGSLATIIAMKIEAPHPHPGAAAPLVLAATAMVAGYTLLAGPQLMRQDFRSDLANADMLKTYPLAGWQVLLGEILTPAIVLSGILWLTLLAAGWAWMSLPSPTGPFNPAAQAMLILGAGIVVPLIVLLQLLIPNGAALLFPAWHQASRTRGGGVEAIGQRLIFVFGQMFAIILALAPAVLLGVLLYIATAWFLGTTAAVAIATTGVVAVIAGELSIGIWWLGTRFERLDIAMELRP